MRINFPGISSSFRAREYVVTFRNFVCVNCLFRHFGDGYLTFPHQSLNVFKASMRFTLVTDKLATLENPSHF